jgi:hypothetical protein
MRPIHIFWGQNAAFKMLTPGEIYNYRCFKDYVRKGWCGVYTHENAMYSNAVHNMACAMEKKRRKK